jgi:hypothetical protein
MSRAAADGAAGGAGAECPSRCGAAEPVVEAWICGALSVFFLAGPLIIGLELLNPILSIALALLALIWVHQFDRFIHPAGRISQNGRPRERSEKFRRGALTRRFVASAAALLLVGLWVYESGIGGFTLCRWDYVKHSVMFWNLLQHPLPIRLSANGTAPAYLHYYFAYYITPVRLYQGLRSIFPGLDLNKLLLLIYIAALYGSLRLLAASFRVPVLGLLVLFIVYGGLDVLGVAAFGGRLWPVGQMPLLHLRLYTGLEWWGAPYAPQSLTSNLYWAPQHFFAALIGMALLSAIFTADRPIPAKFLHGATVIVLSALWSPYAAVGLGVAWAGAATAAALNHRRAGTQHLRDASLRPLLAAAAFPLALLIFVAIFYAAAQAASPPGIVFSRSTPAAWLLTFLLKHAIALSALVVLCFARYAQRPRIGEIDLAHVIAFGLVADAVLLCFTHGTYNDWAMRSTLPLSMLLAAAVCRFMATGAPQGARAFLFVLLLLGSAAPLAEIGQSIAARPGCTPYSAFSLPDLGPLAPQYEGRPDSLLYRHLARSR